MPGDDFQLLDAWRGGDVEAADALFQRHFDRLYRFFQAKAGAGAVEDLVQTTLTRCVEGRDRYRGEAGFSAFLLGIARNVLFEHYKRGRKASFDPMVSSLAELGSSASSVVARRAQERLLAAAIRHIPLDLQIVLELHYWEELTTAAMAEVLDIPVGTVRSRLRRARELLQERMSEIETSDELVTATLGDLGRWAKGLKDQV